MTYPWANTLLLVFVSAAALTGYLGLTNGSPGSAWLLWLHSSAGFAIVALLAWKAIIIWRVVRRPRGLDADSISFFVLAALLLGVLTTGISWGLLGYTTIAGTSLLTIHLILAVGVLLLLVKHVLARRWIFRVGPARDRRAFLRLAGAGVAGLALWQANGLLHRALDLPGARRRFTGSYETGSLTGDFPTVSWLFDDPDRVDAESWRLVIDGAVREPLDLDHAALLDLPRSERTALLDCTGGWYSTQVWRGVPVAGLLDRAGIRDNASSVTFESVTGYDRRFSLDEARTFILATDVAGKTLSHGHGFPLRLVAHDHRGFDWVKWITAIHVNEGSEYFQPPVPLQ